MIDSVFSISFDELSPARDVTRGKRAERGLLREFIGDAQNSLVRHAADSILVDPPLHSPLLFYGPTGVGKTHLAHGLIRLWQRMHPESRALITNGGDFARAYREAQEADAIDEFRQRMRNVGLFFLDNLEQLPEREAAQVELRAIIDELEQRYGQVLINSRSLPADLPQLDSGLVSRLHDGLAVQVTVPGPAARHAILGRLAEIHGLELADRDLDLLADELSNSVGSAPTVAALNGACSRLAFEAEHGSSLRPGDIRNSLVPREPSEQPSLRTITSIVCQHFQLKLADVRGPKRRSQFVLARGVAMLLARQLTDQSYQQIGKHFGGRDHSTVMNACQRIEHLMADDRALRATFTDLRERLAQPQAT